MTIIQMNYRNVHRLDVLKFSREEHIIGLRVYMHVYCMHLIEQLTMECLYSTVHQIKVFALIRNYSVFLAGFVIFPFDMKSFVDCTYDHSRQ